MKKVSIYLSILLLGLIGISSCQEVGQEATEAVQEDALSQVPSEPIFEVDLPNFPAVALHVLESQVMFFATKFTIT